MSVFIVPEKGRNTGVALDRELADEPYDVAWLQELINGRGKHAAKTGVGYDDLETQIESIRAGSVDGEDGGLQLELKPTGRLKPRPVFDRLLLGAKRVESYESPSDAWESGADRFYVGFDQLLEELLARGDPTVTAALAPSASADESSVDTSETDSEPSVDESETDTESSVGTSDTDTESSVGTSDTDTEPSVDTSETDTEPSVDTSEEVRDESGDDTPPEFESLARAAMTERGYELRETIGDRVRWAAMAKDGIPDRPSAVLVPAAFERLGTALAHRRWGPVRTLTFEQYARETDAVGSDEERLLAEAAADVAGVYMYVTGTTAREEYGLTIDPIAGADSRLAIFERETDTTMTDITSLKGFYDRYPDEFTAWREVIDTVEETAQEFGFREVNTPAVERTALYEIKSGDELLDQTYSFDDRGGRPVTLTPEQTPTRARMVQARKDLTTPIKWVDTSKRWRYENVQKGRDREFFQTDIDIFGVSSVEADAEVLACAATIFRRLGVESEVELLVNDRRLLESMLEAEGIDNTVEVMRVVDDKEKLSRAEFFDALAARGVEEDAAERVDELTSIRGPITETIDQLRELAPEDAETAAAIDRMASLADALDSYGVAEMCKLDLSIVRGLAYYTGLVFEAFDTAGELRALFGGGRYDDLVGLFGDREVPAVGFAFGYSTTRELLKRESEWPTEQVTTDVFVANVSESVRDTAIAIASRLRGAGYTVETDLTGRGLGDQFAYADSVTSDWVVIVGERDLANDEVTLRDMDSGEERQVPLDGVTDSVADGFD